MHTRHSLYYTHTPPPTHTSPAYDTFTTVLCRRAELLPLVSDRHPGQREESPPLRVGATVRERQLSLRRQVLPKGAGERSRQRTGVLGRAVREVYGRSK